MGANMLKFYRVDSWMITLAEGFNVTTGLLALIKSFNDNGLECCASTAYLAQFCGCSRRKIFDELRYLTEKGYLKAHKGDSKTDVVAYSVDVEKCMQDAAEIQNEQSAYAESAQALMQNLHKPYAESAQALMQNLHTEKEKGKIRIENEKGNTRARAQSPSIAEQRMNNARLQGNTRTQSPSPGVENVEISNSSESENQPKELTQAQIDHIRFGYVFPTPERKHTADYYLALFPKYDYEKILSFIEHDTRIRSKAEERQLIENAHMYDGLFKEYEI